jgi:hypothetical protein
MPDGGCALQVRLADRRRGSWLLLSCPQARGLGPGRRWEALGPQVSGTQTGSRLRPERLVARDLTACARVAATAHGAARGLGTAVWGARQSALAGGDLYLCGVSRWRDRGSWPDVGRGVWRCKGSGAG